MAGREQVQFDGKDLNEFGIQVIRYEDELLAAPKDGGGLDVEGIDGIIPTNSDIMRNLTGEIEVSIEGRTELDVLDTLRAFKQFLREADFRQISVDNNLGYYRLGKVTQISKSKLYELPGELRSVGFYTFDIVYKDGYEYGINRLDLIYEPGEVGVTTPTFVFNNTGAPNRSLQVSIDTPVGEPLSGRITVECRVEVKKGVTVSVGRLTLGEEGQVTIPSTSSISVDFAEPSIDRIEKDTFAIVPSLSLYHAGQFFTVPRGKIYILVYKINSLGEPEETLEARARLQFSPKYN